MKINFDRIDNARDLGGIETADHRRIKTGKLIRSGKLSKATKRDVQQLEVLGLKMVVDFRNRPEAALEPDMIIDGVQYCKLPTIDEGDVSTVVKGKELALLKQYYDTPDAVIEQINSVYEGLVCNEIALKAYSDFIRILLNNGEGLTLWHCSYGKDRAGTATAILLAALGVERDEIIKDYLLTNEMIQKKLKIMSLLLTIRMHSRKYIPLFEKVMSVDESYMRHQFATIDKIWGGVDGFLHNGLHVSDEEIEQLKAMYLEDCSQT